MTAAEVIAFNAGVTAVLTLAKRAADGLAPKVIHKPTRYNFALEALAALAEEGRGLLITPPPADSAPAVSRPSGPTPIVGGAMAKATAR